MKPFEDVSTIDELRRFAAGLMSSDERTRFESELQRDPELARLAEEFLLVWQATAGGTRPRRRQHREFRRARGARPGGRAAPKHLAT
jgi:anti-sigma factor RsiW